MIKGTWKDVWYDANGNVLGIQVGNNIWTEPASRFFMGAATGHFNSGNVHHAFGVGEEAWDTAVPFPKPNVYQTTLTNEVLRKPVSDKYFMKIGHGRAQSGSLTGIHDPWREDPVTSLYRGRFEPDDIFNGVEVSITSGTNTGEVRNVVDYDQITGTIVVDSPFPQEVDDTTEYLFTPEPSVVPTNAVEFRTVLDYGDLSEGVYLREHGLFFGDDAENPNEGFMIDCIRHAKIYKDGTVRLVRFITLSFNP